MHLFLDYIQIRSISDALVDSEFEYVLEKIETHIPQIRGEMNTNRALVKFVLISFQAFKVIERMERAIRGLAGRMIHQRNQRNFGFIRTILLSYQNNCIISELK